jgi:hypothetical protein
MNPLIIHKFNLDGPTFDISKMLADFFLLEKKPARIVEYTDMYPWEMESKWIIIVEMINAPGIKDLLLDIADIGGY